MREGNITRAALRLYDRSKELADNQVFALQVQVAHLKGTVRGLRFRVAEQRAELWEQNEMMYRHARRTLDAVKEIAELKLLVVKHEEGAETKR